MLTHTVFSLALSASVSPPYQPLVLADEYTAPDGHRTRWASVTYTLPDGQAAEVVLIADDADRGDGYVYVDGEAIVHSSWDASRGVENWTSTVPGVDGLAAAALIALSDGPAEELLDAFSEGPQEFPCSEWGKKVLRAGRYIWTGMVAASVGACCVETAFFGCALCSGAGAMAGMAGNEALGGYCD